MESQPVATTSYFDACATTLTPKLRSELRGWAGLAVAALAVAGVLALLLAFARTPKLQDILPWPWEQFFYKALVTHVVFSIIVWFLGALGALTVLATARVTGGAPLGAALGPTGLWMAFVGFALLSVPALLNQGEPSLNNYVPILIHPLFYAGLCLLAAGVALAVLRLLVNLPSAVRIEAPDWGMVSAGAVFLVALVCFALAYALIPSGTEEALFNERLFWGGGHVLQFVNTLLMMVGWYVLTEMTVGAPPISPRLFTAAVAVLFVAVLPALFIYSAFDVVGREHRDAFTQLLWYGLTLPPAVVLVGAGGLVLRRVESQSWRSPAFVGLVLSLVLFGVGGVMGFFLGVGDTRTPSHYHAVIGSVNLVIMTLYFSLLLPLLGLSARRSGAVRWSFLLYGGGQILFSLGMFIAGAAGVPRKTAGVEQHLDSLAKIASMVVYGSGGVIAVIGGIMFVWKASALLLTRGSSPLASVSPVYAGVPTPVVLGKSGVVMFVALALVLLALMPVWRWVAQPLPLLERYDISTTAFTAKVDAMVSQYGTGEKTSDGGLVVRPPSGDVYIHASRWRFDPVLELEVGKTYRLHVASTDVMHGFNFPLGEADLLLTPGSAFVMTVAPTQPGIYAMQCSEYCGIQHSRMKGFVRVMPIR